MHEETWKKILAVSRKGPVAAGLIQPIKETVLTSRSKFKISFGTSGWRGIIGEDYTVYQVQVVTQAIVNLYRNHTKQLAASLGINSFEAFKHQGVLIGHDTRYLGETFARAAAAVLNRAGVRVAYAGTATTPEFSAAVPMERFACAINLTSSHNPGNYGGYKFNPADGGPADKEITAVIEQEYAEIKQFQPCPPENAHWEPFDVLSAYINFIESRGFVDLDYCRKLAASGKIALATDSVFGATKGRPFAILDRPKALKQLRIEEEPFFQGTPPEPSSQNMTLLKAYFQTQYQDLKLGAIMDPDGDRIRFFDGESDISMNQFGAIAFHYLATRRNRPGGAAKTVATSNFVNHIAEKLGRPLYETAVGFKNFRPYLHEGTREPAVVCFEESDGISGYGNTLEKDAQIGFLLALEITGRTGRNLTAYLRNLQREYGFFYPVRHNFEVERAKMGGPVKAVMQNLKSTFRTGQSLPMAKTTKTVKKVITLDGLKLIFEDKSWLLIRPSGTEPKVRVYTEARDEKASQDLFEAAKTLFHTEMKKK